jgi:hypothetical protein
LYFDLIRISGDELSKYTLRPRNVDKRTKQNSLKHLHKFIGVMERLQVGTGASSDSKQTKIFP